MVIYNKRQYILIACEQALPGALAAGREKEGELAPTSLEFEFHLQFPYGFPQLQLLLAIISRVFQLILLKLFKIVYIIIRQGAPLGLAVQMN